MAVGKESVVTRRDAITAGIAGAASIASASALGTGCVDAASPNPDGASTGKAAGRMPVAFFPHGGGPWPFVDLGFDKSEVGKLADYTRSIAALAPTPPKALLVVSAHWEESVPTLMTAERPPILYDYYGFPAESYQIEWPAPGAPGVAARVASLLQSAGFRTASDDRRGFDHGTFVPLKLAYPNAEIPTVQLSLISSLDPSAHLAMGRALTPLRDEGVLILGSGMSFHNLRAFRDKRYRVAAQAFDEWLRDAAMAETGERDRRLVEWEGAPSARDSHPREEHLLPMMVVAGAAGSDAATIAYNEPFAGMPLSAIHYG
ncbi:MAG: dioxygenase [Polyangiaceae bacterium]|nr:dioxygenase [Polyangiaceae bacterium]